MGNKASTSNTELSDEADRALEAARSMPRTGKGRGSQEGETSSRRRSEAFPGNFQGPILSLHYYAAAIPILGMKPQCNRDTSISRAKCAGTVA
jgi:hypothetical protein